MLQHKLVKIPIENQETNHFFSKNFSLQRTSPMQPLKKKQESNYRPKSTHILPQSKFMPISAAQLHQMLNSFFKFAPRISEAPWNNGFVLCAFPAMMKRMNSLCGQTVSLQIALVRYRKNDEGVRSKFRAESAWFCSEREKCRYLETFKNHRYVMQHLTAVHPKFFPHKYYIFNAQFTKRSDGEVMLMRFRLIKSLSAAGGARNPSKENLI